MKVNAIFEVERQRMMAEQAAAREKMARLNYHEEVIDTRLGDMEAERTSGMLKYGVGGFILGGVLAAFFWR